MFEAVGFDREGESNFVPNTIALHQGTLSIKRVHSDFLPVVCAVGQTYRC